MAKKCNKPERRGGEEEGGPPMSSKEMPPLPQNFAPVFFQNQFRTTIPLPTKADYPDVEGKVAIVTGSNTGLGYEASRQLLELGLSHLVMGVRSYDKGQAAAEKLKAFNPNARIDVWGLDMESYSSIQAFARKCQQDLSRLDLAILNAGTMASTFHKSTTTQHERTVQVNHLGTSLLAILLIPVVRSKTPASASASPPGKITIVNSVTAQLVNFDPKRNLRPILPAFDDPATYEGSGRYGLSKLLNQLFLVKLCERIDPNKVTINMVDPGLTKGTGLHGDAKGLQAYLGNAFLSIAGRPVERGSATYIDAALGKGVESHACFLMNCEVAPLSKWYYSDVDDAGAVEATWRETIEELRFAGVEEIIEAAGY